MRSQIGRPKAMTPVDFRRLPGGLHGVAKQASLSVAFRSYFWRFWNDFERFWEAKMDAKTDFLEVTFRCFFRMRFCMDFWLLFGGLKPEKSLKTIGFSMVFVNFQKIAICEKVSKKH